MVLLQHKQAEPVVLFALTMYVMTYKQDYFFCIEYCVPRGAVPHVQHWGVAEGKPWSYISNRNFNLEEEMAKGIYPVPHGNDGKFPDGENLDDLERRAKEVVITLVLPHVWQTAKKGKAGVHVAVVGHGLCISQLISQLLRMSANQDEELDYRGLLNTAWTRVVIESEVRVLKQ